MQGALLARCLPHTSPNGDVVLGRAIERQMAVEGMYPAPSRTMIEVLVRPLRL